MNETAAGGQAGQMVREGLVLPAGRLPAGARLVLMAIAALGLAVARFGVAGAAAATPMPCVVRPNSSCPNTLDGEVCAKPCFATIGAAVAAASPGDTIAVANGTYKEDVVIKQSVTLIGNQNNPNKAIIDAAGLSNGIYIDGIDAPGLNTVEVSGFKVENANFEGILVTNASLITILTNIVQDNDLGLVVTSTTATCPGLPDFETQEEIDCGQGIHLSGVENSTIANNLVQNNSGGILLSDDTGPTHDNLVGDNTVQNNAFDTGITLASHTPAESTGVSTPLGVFYNTISGNVSAGNGTDVPGGAGVGIFADATNGMVFGNLVSNNAMTNNGRPGVAFHSNDAFDNLDDNMVVGNSISGNGPDATQDEATSETTGINIFGLSEIKGTIISQNEITKEDVDIAANTPNVTVAVNFNALKGATAVGVENLNSSTTVDATGNFWGCAKGPGHSGCSSIAGPGAANVFYQPFLTSD